MKKIDLDKRLKDLNIGIIGLNNQFEKMNKNLEVQNLILLSNSEIFRKNTLNTIGKIKVNYENIIKVLKNESEVK
jgi:hypothetical protein